MTTIYNIITSNNAPISSFGPAERVFNLMQKDFGFSIKDRLVVTPEVAMFRIKEDESIYQQAKTEKYDYQVHFDGEFVCYFSLTDHPQRIRINILKGLKELVKKEKIFWDLKMYKIKQMEAEDAARAENARAEARRTKATTSEEKMVEEAIRRAVLKPKKS